MMNGQGGMHWSVRGIDGTGCTGTDQGPISLSTRKFASKERPHRSSVIDSHMTHDISNIIYLKSSSMIYQPFITYIDASII